ncbi:hypothetical protein AXG93_215s1130 [Marchantia polymorpha subsp. ruderalis]|uniref:Cytochrome P450 n=1 Tax=Marchantia polymorpha subsp. ruderalis TaxID=1480154 RepID=A0A176W3R7_MARPO|nr:hypothetical protein AXG93_215s1130 [Marchantia polymorpha subsp. ruderalis]
MVEQMALSYSEKEYQNYFQTYQAMVRTAYESSSYILQLGCVIVLLVLCVCFYRLKQNARLGPRYWPLLGSVRDISAHYCHLHDWLLGFFLFAKTIHVRMPWGRVFYCTVDPINVQYLLETNSVNFRKGKGFFKRMEVLLGQKELHESWIMRKWVASEFCKPSVCDLTAAVMKKKTCTIARPLAEVAGKGTTVDIQDGRDIEEDDTLPAGDVFISSQKGNVFFAPYSMARMTSIWGLDAALFNPDRWLQSDKLEPASDNKFVTFQVGSLIFITKRIQFELW